MKLRKGTRIGSIELITITGLLFWIFIWNLRLFKIDSFSAPTFSKIDLDAIFTFNLLEDSISVNRIGIIPLNGSSKKDLGLISPKLKPT